MVFYALHFVYLTAYIPKGLKCTAIACPLIKLIDLNMYTFIDLLLYQVCNGKQIHYPFNQTNSRKSSLSPVMVDVDKCNSIIPFAMFPDTYTAHVTL